MNKDEIKDEVNEIQSTQVGESSAEGDVFTARFGDYVEEDEYREEPLAGDVDDDNDDDNDDQGTIVDVANDDQDDQDKDESEEEKERRETEEEAEDLQDYSDAAIVAMSIQKSGALPEDFEINKELDWSSLSENITKTAVESGQQYINNQLEQIGEAKKYVDFLLKGGNINTLAQAMGNANYSKMEIDGDGEDFENNRDLVTRAYYVDKGIPNDDIDDLIQNLKDSGRDVERANLAKEYFNEKESESLAEDERQRQAQHETQQQQAAQKAQVIEQYISGGVVGDFKLDKKDQAELHQAIFTPTEVVDVVTPEGNTVKQKVTKIQLLEHQFKNSPEQQVIFAKLLLNGFNVQAVANQAANNEHDELLRHLNSRTTQRAERKQSKRTKRKSNGIQSNQVGEY